MPANPRKNLISAVRLTITTKKKRQKKKAVKKDFIYSGYGIAFDRSGSYSYGNTLTQTVLILAADNRSS